MAIFILSGYGMVVLSIFSVGILLICTTRKSARLADASQSWPATTGRITEARTSYSRFAEDWSVRISYEYQVLGQSYTGTKVAFGVAKSYQTPIQAENDLACYPPDWQVTVYYDPSNPAEAVLERKVGGTSRTTFVTALGVVLISFGLCNFCPFIFYGLAAVIGTLTQ
jgi:hypothetical protein